MDEHYRCWCGDLVDPETLGDLPDRCGGIGVLYCECGGDFCVCHHHDSVDCPGCEDCGAGCSVCGGPVADDPDHPGWCQNCIDSGMGLL